MAPTPTQKKSKRKKNLEYDESSGGSQVSSSSGDDITCDAQPEGPRRLPTPTPPTGAPTIFDHSWKSKKIQPKRSTRKPSASSKRRPSAPTPSSRKKILILYRSNLLKNEAVLLQKELQDRGLEAVLFKKREGCNFLPVGADGIFLLEQEIISDEPRVEKAVDRMLAMGKGVWCKTHEAVLKVNGRRIFTCDGSPAQLAASVNI